MPSSEPPRTASCPIDRARFLRTTALAALAGSALVADPAFAQSVESTAPLKTQGTELIYALPAKDGAHIDSQNGIIIARVKNDIYAMSITCPHRAVTTLEWQPDNREFYCPKHHAHFEPDGELIDGRPDRAMDRFAIRRAGAILAVDTSAQLQQDSEHDAWTRAVLRV